MGLPHCITPCCCIIYQDDFSASSSDYLDVSGTWDRDFGIDRLFTNDTGAILQLNSARNTSGRGNVSAVVSIDTAGGSARLIGSYFDTSNYLYAELTINGAASTFKLWKRAAGVDTQLGSTYTFTGAVDTDYTLALCWDQAYATAILNLNQKVFHEIYTGTGQYVALGASANGGTVYFDDFLFKKHYKDDSRCGSCGGGGIECRACTQPYEGGYEFDVSGLGPNTTCCGEFDGLYILPGPPEQCGDCNTETCWCVFDQDSISCNSGTTTGLHAHFVLTAVGSMFGFSSTHKALYFGIGGSWSGCATPLDTIAFRLDLGTDPVDCRAISGTSMAAYLAFGCGVSPTGACTATSI